MKIKVFETDTKEVIFKGESNQFLIDNENDEFLVNIIESLNNEKIDDVTIGGGASPAFTISKL